MKLSQITPRASSISRKARKSKILFGKSYEDGFVQLAFGFCLCFKHGIHPIGTIKNLCFTVRKYQYQSYQLNAKDCLDLLRVQLEEEKSAFDKFHQKVQEQAKAKTSCSIYLRQIARLKERTHVLDTLLHKYLDSQFQLCMVVSSAMTMCFGTNQAILRCMRNAIQHFCVEDDDDNIVFFNKNPKNGDDINFVFAWNNDAFRLHVKLFIYFSYEIILSVLTGLLVKLADFENSKDEDRSFFIELTNLTKD